MVLSSLTRTVLILLIIISAAPTYAFDDAQRKQLLDTKSCQRCDLRAVNLKKAILNGANLQGADLRDADLEYADLRSANLSRAKLYGADFEGANLAFANLSNVDAAGSCDQLQSNPADFGTADLHNADLQNARLCWVKLSHAILREAKLGRANLFKAKLMGANLWEADLQEADLGWANLIGSDVGGADMRGAYLPGTDLDRAKLVGTNLSRACYAPATAPQAGALSDIKGLGATFFPSDAESGLILLREQLQKAGLRRLEREAIYAIEHNKTRHLLYGRVDQDYCRPPDQRNPTKNTTRLNQLTYLLDFAEGAFRLVAFEWPVAYGLRPGRAIWILFWTLTFFAAVYAVVLVSGIGIICRIWPDGRVERIPSGGLSLAECSDVEPLQPKTVWAWLGHAFQFSLLSAFHLGWRELNVGNWIARLQTREYTLRGIGWVRTVAGLQSLLSVYLLALWVLTYFGSIF